MKKIQTSKNIDSSDFLTSLNSYKNSILIIYVDVVGWGCRECLGLEVTEWQDFVQQDSIGKSSKLFLSVSRVSSMSRLQQEMRAMRVQIPIFLDNDESIVKSLNIVWTPEVYFLRYGRVIANYTGDMNDRVKTETMKKKYRDFLLLTEREWTKQKNIKLQ